MANESITLTTPVTQPAIASFSPGSLYLQLQPDPRIVITLIRTDGKGEVFEYPAAGTAQDTPAKVTALIDALNTANLSTRSLWRRVFDKLVTDFPSRFTGGATVV
jgi:hypothetical protein